MSPSGRASGWCVGRRWRIVACRKECQCSRSDPRKPLISSEIGTVYFLAFGAFARVHVGAEESPCVQPRFSRDIQGTYRRSSLCLSVLACEFLDRDGDPFVSAFETLNKDVERIGCGVALDGPHVLVFDAPFRHFVSRGSVPSGGLSYRHREFYFFHRRSLAVCTAETQERSRTSRSCRPRRASVVLVEMALGRIGQRVDRSRCFASHDVLAGMDVQPGFRRKRFSTVGTDVAHRHWGTSSMLG